MTPLEHTMGMTRNEAWLVARQCAQACGTYVVPFEPPEWALVAIQAAANGVIPDLPSSEVEKTLPLAPQCAAVDVEL